MDTVEVNFEGLVGPTHNYAALSYGNIASVNHRGHASHPKAAALQGLAKMRVLFALGIRQAVLPPQERPDVESLRRVGFTGSDSQMIRCAAEQAPEILAACYSASSMWAANAATVTPSMDSGDGRVHLTPANLISNFHRAIEAQATGKILRTLFHDESFVHHPPLPCGHAFGDEGAANHIRFCKNHAGRGIHLFVFGRYSLRAPDEYPTRFPARQTFEASAAVRRLHSIPPEQVVYARQHPAVINAGAFHNDVIATGNQDFLLYHQLAYLDANRVIDELKEKFSGLTGESLRVIEVSSQQMSLEEAVASYFFNSQLVTLTQGGTVLIAPIECQESARVSRFISDLRSEADITEVRFIDLRESMQNGGGPACLRLRVVLSEEELKRVKPGIFFSPNLAGRLETWISRHFRDTLCSTDLADPALAEESRQTLDDLTSILGLGSIYRFQTSEYPPS